MSSLLVPAGSRSSPFSAGVKSLPLQSTQWCWTRRGNRLLIRIESHANKETRMGMSCFSCAQSIANIKSSHSARIHCKKLDAIPCIKSAHPLSLAQSAVQRRPPDSYGRSGQGETLQATPKRLTARPMESGWPQRNGTGSSPLHIHKKYDGVSMFRISTLLLLSTECSAAKASRLLWEKRAG